MKNSTWQPIVRTILEHHRSGKPWISEPATIPARVYTCRDHLAAERGMLESNPQVVGLSADLPEKGSFFTRDNLEVPLVVMRGEDGVIRAFANVCLHRCAQVVQDSRGCARRHSCHYHGWTYGSDGKLVGVPSRDSFPNVDIGTDQLPQLPTFEKHGVIWVTLRPASDGVSEPDVGFIGDDFDNFDFDGYDHWRTHRFDLAMNWKLVMDTFMESYHVGALHKESALQFFMPNLFVTDHHGPHLRHVVPRRSLVKLEEQAPEDWDPVPHTTVIYALFPNALLVIQKDHIETWRTTPNPTDPARCVSDFDLYIPKGELTELANAHWEKNFKAIIDVVIEEDFAAMHGVQRGLNARMLDHLQVGANETGLRLYHAALDDALAASSQG